MLFRSEPKIIEEPVFDANLGFEQRYFPKYTNAQADDQITGDAGFGSKFPDTPSKGDVFLRVDFLPSRMFKYNGNKWIEVDKDTNDRLVYNQAYIEHLIEKIQKGEYDIDDVSETERTEIETFLKNHGTTLQ